MTEDDKKLLTEYLGECWHKLEKDGYEYTCSLCGRDGDAIETSRTFDTWQDSGDLITKVVEKGEFKSLENWFLHLDISCFDEDSKYDSLFEYYLNPVRFCQLVCSYLKERSHE